MSQGQAVAGSGFGVINPVEILIKDISAIELDSKLEQVVLSFEKGGKHGHFGVMLIKGLPGSRPRKATTKSNPESPASYKIVNTAYTQPYRGCYLLQEKTEEKDSNFWTTKETQSRGQPEINDLQFFKGLDVRCEIGVTSTDIEANSVVRFQLGLERLFPITQGIEQLSNLATLRGCKSLAATFINISTAGAVSRVKTSPVGLTTIIYHHRGSPRVWIVVPSTEKLAFEDMIRGAFGDQLNAGEECSQFISHYGLFLSPELLEHYRIKFVLVEQEHRQIAVIFPNSYYWGYSRGFSVVEQRLWNMSSWSLDDAYKFCKPENKLCSRSHETSDAYLCLNQSDIAEAKNMINAKRSRKRKGSTVDGEDDIPQNGSNEMIQTETLQDVHDGTPNMSEHEWLNYQLHAHIAFLESTINEKVVLAKQQSDALDRARTDRRRALEYIELLKQKKDGDQLAYRGRALADLETLREKIEGDQDVDEAAEEASTQFG